MSEQLPGESFLDFMLRLQSEQDLRFQIMQQAQQNQQQQKGNQPSLDMVQQIMDKFSGGGESVMGGESQLFDFGGLGSTGGGDLFGGGAEIFDFGGIGSTGSGGTAGGGAGGGGLGAAGIGGIVAAAILGQHLMSKETDTTFEGQQTGDIFSGNFTTEPWLAFLSDKFDLGVTPGEKFDAAIKNRDWGTALKRTPSTALQWADPFGELLSSIARKQFGSDVGNVLDPGRFLVNKLEDIF